MNSHFFHNSNIYFDNYDDNELILELLENELEI